MSDTSRTAGHHVAMRSPSADLIEQFAANLRLRGRSAYTLAEWPRILTRIDQQLSYGLDQAHPAELVEVLGTDGWSPATRRAYWRCLTSFYRWATAGDESPLIEDPMEAVPEPPPAARGVPKPCTDDELATILLQVGEPYRLWCLLAAYGGARCLEIARLDREDVGETVTYLHGKGDKPGAVPTHRLVWAAVRDLPPGPLVRYRAGRRPGQRVTGRYVSHMSVARFAQLGMRGMHLHRLRHWYATRTLEACGDLRIVQELLRHASPDTTQVYTQVSAGRRSAAVSALPDLASAAGGSAVVDAVADGRPR